MNFYSLLYKFLISKLPDKWIELGGGPFFNLRSLFWFKKEISIPFQIGDHHFLNPVGMPAGWIDTPKKEKIVRRFGVGVAVIKTITPDPKEGNPYPRIIRKGEDIINSMGLPNKGLEWWVENYQPSTDHPTIISIKGNSIKEWQKLIENLESKTDIFELNLSCPNISDGILDIKSTVELVQKISSITDKDIFLKLSPEYSGKQNLELVKKIRSEITGISLINTVPVVDENLGNSDKKGGRSGKSIYDQLISQLVEIRDEYPYFNDLPIFAMGGIYSGQQAWDIVNTYKAIPLALTSFLTRGPGIYHEFLTTIRDNLEKREMSFMKLLNS